MVSLGRSGAPYQPASSEKVVILIVDGLGDITIPALGDRTPLEVSHVPTMDAIAGAWSNDVTLLQTPIISLA